MWLLPVIRDVFRNVDDCDILKHDSEPRYIQSWRDLIVHLVSKDLDGINVVLPVDFSFKELPPQKIIHFHQSPTMMKLYLTKSIKDIITMPLPPLVYWQGARWQEQEEYKTKIFWNLENWLKSVYSFLLPDFWVRAYGPLEIFLHDLWSLMLRHTNLFILS